MCGICGIFNVNGEPVSPVVLRRMTDAMAHRGPDGEGFYIDSFWSAVIASIVLFEGWQLLICHL